MSMLPVTGFVQPSIPALMPPNRFFNAPITPAASGVGPPIQSPLINGGSGLFQQSPGTQQSHMSVYLPLNANLAGIRDLLPALLLEGSQATKQFIAQCEARGIELAAGLSGDKLQLNAIGPAGNEAVMVQALMQLLTRPVVDNATFTILKEDALKNLQSAQSDPHLPLSEAINKGMYGSNHPYAATSRDVMQRLSRQTLSSVMGAYQQALIWSEQARLMVVSPQPIEQQQMLVNQGIQQAGWFASPYRQAMTPPVPSIAPRHGVNGPMLIPNESFPKALITHAWRAPMPNAPDYPAFMVLRQLLEGSSGQFFKTLRTQKGLVYGSQQSYMAPGGRTANYAVEAQVDYDKVASAVQTVRQVVASFIQSPVSPDALAMAKRKFLFGLNSAKQTSDGIAGLNAAWVQNDLAPPDPVQLQAAIERVTPWDIQRAANRIFNPAQGYEVLGISAPRTVLSSLSHP